MSSSSADLDALSGFRLGEEMGGKIMFPQVLKREVGLGCGRGESVGARIVSIEKGWYGQWVPSAPARRMMMAYLAVGNGWRGVAVRVVPNEKANQSDIDVVPRAVYCVHVLIG